MKRMWMAFGFACVLAVSAAHGQELVGEWDMKMDYQGSVIDSKMKVTKGDDGALAGTWAGRLGETELRDLKVEGNTLTFTRTVQVQGQEFDIAFTGTIAGDAITGAYETAMGTMNVSGARAGGSATGGAVAAGDLTLLVGDWLADVSSALGDFQHTLIFKGDGTGVYDAGDVKYDLTEVALAGADVTFAMTIDIEGQQLPLKFQGKLEGDALNGELVSDMGNGTVKAKRAGAAGPAIVGTWDVTSESQLGTLKRTLVVNPDLSGTYKTDTAEFAISNLKQDGNNVGFNVTVDVQGQQLPLEFAGAIDGSVLTGELKSELGNAAVTATKAGGAVAGGGDAELRATVEKLLGELKAQNIDAMLAHYAEDFKDDQGGGKPELTTFLTDAKDQGMLADMGAKTEEMKVTIDGTNAVVENIELEGAFGVLTLSLELQQRDGVWLVVSQTTY